MNEDYRTYMTQLVQCTRAYLNAQNAAKTLDDYMGVTTELVKLNDALLDCEELLEETK